MCGICGKLDKGSLCKKCNLKLKKYAIFKIENYNETSSYFDEHIYIFKYNEIIRKIIIDYKFNEKSYIYETLANFVKNNKKICSQIQKYDIIIPIPISRKRLKKRGYNQSSIFAKRLANFLNVDFTENILIKTKDNSPQSTLKHDERIKNVEGVYKIKNKEIINDKKVLIVDDIFTTGNTVNE